MIDPTARQDTAETSLTPRQRAEKILNAGRPMEPERARAAVAAATAWALLDIGDQLARVVDRLDHI